MSAGISHRFRGKVRDAYLELVVAFPLASVRTVDHLGEAQKVIDGLLGRGSLNYGEEMYLDALSDLVAAYEDEDGIDMDQIAVDGEPTAFDVLQEDEQREFLYACIERLPEDQREVLLMRHESDLTFREIAELTDCSINTALGRMRYALHNLRRMMNETNVNELKRIELASS